MSYSPKFSRRDFLKLAALSLGSLGLRPWQRLFALSDFPTADRLGRVVWWGTELKSAPDSNSSTIRNLMDDEVLPWLRETVGSHPAGLSQRWVETPEGYVWSPHLQQVRNQLNVPLESLPQTSLGEGMWVETWKCTI